MTATSERNENARPEIKNEIADFPQYDVFFEYPTRWGDMPMIVYRFLESYDFSGKTVIPFNTHEGSVIILPKKFNVTGDCKPKLHYMVDLHTLEQFFEGGLHHPPARFPEHEQRGL